MSDNEEDETLWQGLKEQHRGDSALYQQAAAYACDYLNQVNDRPVFPTPEAVQALAATFVEDFPDGPTEAAIVLERLHTIGSPATVAQNGRYFGFVNGGVLPPALAARMLADSWDQNAALYKMSPVASTLEGVCEGWLADCLGLPKGTAAGLVSGTSTATLCGLAAGRDFLLREHHGWSVTEQGLSGAPPLRVVTSAAAHGSVRKALSLLGLGRAQIEYVPADEQGRLDATQLPVLDNRTLLILQAGNVNSGSFDPFVAACTVARQAGAWTHIDGAFGLWAAACAQTRHLTQGIELADSWSVDGHKTLNTPYDCGVVLCRNRQALAQALQSTGAYMEVSAERDGMMYVPEMSRRARGIELWALLKAMGRSGVDALIARLCDRAAYFGQRLAERDFSVLNEVVFNQVLVSCATDEETRATLRGIQEGGVCWCGGSIWKDRAVIRVSVCSWMTTRKDVERSVEAFVASREQAIQSS
jgi:glutamate/tyrosine decarboxylase-like PLP-dependent enzyme